ncbi:MAG: AAA family ATPase [Pirellulales bacterium]|nr:AAA family ATPase [Pirellulales bacterium]
MKLTDIQIDGFGVWQGLELRDLSDRCTVFYGANEAGKSTLLQFLRAALYGFSPARRARYLPPVRGGIAGGTLSVVDRAGKRFRIFRQDHADQPLGAITLEAADGTTKANFDLRGLLHDVDETTFNHVFAVGLSEIQELGTLTDIDAAKWMYSLTAGLDRVSLAEVVGELETSRTRIAAVDGSRCEVSDLVAQRDRLERELSQLSLLPREHARLAAQRDDCGASIAEAERELTARESEHRAAVATAAVYELFHRRTLLGAQIAALSPPEPWPAGSLERMNRLTEAMKRRRRQFKKLSVRRQRLSSQEAKIADNESLCRLAPRVAALAEHESWILSIEQELGEAQATVAQWTDQQQSQQAKLKNSATNSTITSMNVDDRGWAMLRSLGEHLVKARRRAKAADAQQSSHRGNADSAHQQLASALASRGQRDLTAAIEAAGLRVTQLRRRVQLEDRIEQLTGAKADLENEISMLHNRRVMPPWQIWGLGALFALGVIMILGGWFFASWGWTTIMVGVIALLVAGGTKISRDLTISKQLAEAENQVQLAVTQFDDDTAERTQLDRALPKQSSDWATQLAAAQRDLSHLEQLLPLDLQIKSAAQSASDADQRAQQAKKRYRKSLRRWRAALASQGLPTELMPTQVREMSVAGNQLRGVAGRLQEARSDFDRHRRELVGLAAQIEQVFLAAGITPSSESASQRLKQLRSELAEHETRRQQRETCERLRRKLRRRQSVIRRRIERAIRRRRLLLRDCQVTDVATFRRRAEESSKRIALIADHDDAGREIASRLAGVTTEDAAEAILAEKTAPEVDAIVSAAAQRLTEARDRHRQLCERRGQLNEQIRAIAADRQPALKRLELNQIERKLFDAFERWQVLTITRGVLLSVKADYERNRQPETLREASQYLRQLTRGRYNRVWTRFGENVLTVDDAQGRPLPVDRLSRGTREQLFLSLRLALVGLFARQGIELPMILDDVLVNFDSDRAAAAVRVLRKFADRGHPLLIFTCHEHIARMFKRKGVDVRRLPDHAIGGRDRPYEIEPAPARRVRPRPSNDIPSSEPGPLPQFDLLPREEHFIVTAEAPVGQVEVRLVEPPEPLSTIEAEVESNIQRLVPAPQSVRKPKRRLDPPHRAPRWAAIRRGWNAEEFTGELDDQINPLWMPDARSQEEENSPDSSPPTAANANPPMRIIHSRLGPRSFKLLTDEEYDESPIIAELPDDDLEADNKLA